jgi:hypothetical protein
VRPHRGEFPAGHDVPAPDRARGRTREQVLILFVERTTVLRKLTASYDRDLSG